MTAEQAIITYTELIRQVFMVKRRKKRLPDETLLSMAIKKILKEHANTTDGKAEILDRPLGLESGIDTRFVHSTDSTLPRDPFGNTYVVVIILAVCDAQLHKALSQW